MIAMMYRDITHSIETFVLSHPLVYEPKLVGANENVRCEPLVATLPEQSMQLEHLATRPKALALERAAFEAPPRLLGGASCALRCQAGAWQRGVRDV